MQQACPILDLSDDIVMDTLNSMSIDGRLSLPPSGQIPFESFGSL